MKRMMVLALASFAAATMGAQVFKHGIYSAVSLDGEWEMAYQPYAHEVVECPEFKGVKIANAVPGYWEDMVPAFRAAGMKDEFRINPLFERQRFPITGWASDTTLPNIYGCFFYRRTIDLDETIRGAPGVRALPTTNCQLPTAVLAFEGVRNQVHVWINGTFVAFRAGFSTPFELAVPNGALKKGRNESVLAVSNNPNLGYCDYVSGLTTRLRLRERTHHALDLPRDGWCEREA